MELSNSIFRNTEKGIATTMTRSASTCCCTPALSNVTRTMLLSFSNFTTAKTVFIARPRARTSYRNALPMLLIWALTLTLPAQAQLKPQTAQLFQRLFSSPEFEPSVFGPARWLEDGASYTTVEASTAFPHAKDIVRCATMTGGREVLVSASQLVPTGAKEPLMIEDYSWSADMQSLLVFTNSQPVWRQRTRGDYWVLNRKTGGLHQLGGGGL